MLKYFTCLLTAFTFSAATANDTRNIPLEVQSMNGCRINNGIISLHKQLPSQEKSENVVLESENALSLFYQEDVFARKSGQKADQLIQIKKSAEDYTPQSDSTASGGKYIDYCTHAVYQFNIKTPGKYYIWARHWVPFKANWGYSMQIGKEKESINLSSAIPAAKTWFWVKCMSVDFNKGMHSIRVSNLLNGKRLDCIVLTPDKNFNPANKTFKATKLTPVNNGTVFFKPITPVGLLNWQKLSYKKLNNQGSCIFSIYDEKSKKWSRLNSSDLRKSGHKRSEPLAVRLDLHRKNSATPKITDIKAFYTFDSSSFVILENKFSKLLFSRKTGALTGIINNLTGTAIQPSGIKTVMFDLLLKEPGNKKRIWVSQKDAKLKSAKLISKDTASIHWLLPAYSVEVIFEIKQTAAELSKWQVTIINNNKKLDVLEVEAPRLAELKVSSSPEQDTLIWPFSAGEFIKYPASRGEHSTAYPDHAGLAYVDLYNSREGLYFGCHDPLLVATHFISKANFAQNAIELSINRKHRIKAGSSLTYHFALAPHVGDWHKGARFYRDFFYSRYPVNKYVPWLRRCDAWKMGGAAGHSGLVHRHKSYRALIKDYMQASFLSLPYIQSWGSIFNGACPTFYLPRIDKGGEKLFIEMNALWRNAGGQLGYYFHGNSVTPYYLLTDKYFTVSWDKYPKKHHPPSWDWYIKNREYTSENSTVDKKKMLAQTAKLNAMHLNMPKLKHGNQEERLTGYMPMSWHSKAFSNYLRKWISLYIKKYECSTAYLDTFAFRNDRADFNPYLKLHGEGDKPMYKMDFLKSLMKDMRKAEPGFSALTEGVADVFGTKLYFLLSGFARNPNIFRYTIPDQIFFQGSCNALWTKPLTKKSISQAFLMGNRFDLVTIFPHTYYMLRLRQRVSPFLNYAVFDDNTGITVSEPTIEMYAHVTLPETNKFINNFGSKCVAFTISNPLLKTAKVIYKLPSGFKPDKAYYVELYKEPVKLEFKNHGKDIAFNLHPAEMSCIILTEKLAATHRWTAVLEQPAEDKFTAKIFNYSNQPVNLKVSAQYSEGAEVGPAQNLTIPAGGLKKITFKDNTGSSAFRMVKVKISSPAYSKDYIISLGKTGRRIPRPEKFVPQKPEKVTTSPKQTATNLLQMNFEAPEFCKETAFKGKRSFKLAGNGKYVMHKFPLKLEKNSTYKISLAIRKSFDVSPVSHHNNVVVANYTPDKKLKLYLNLGTSTPRDNKWHILAGTFKTDDNLNNCGLYFYNKNSKGTVWIDEIRIDKIK